MRNPYTCIFERTLRTRVWSLSPSTRCVWLWLRLVADPEGYVNADLAGVAAGANVTPDEARRAIDGFLAPDPDADPDDPREGRVLERVRGGWLILDYAESVERVRAETRNARNAKYARARRARESAEREEARAYLDLEETASNDVEPTEGHPDASVAPSKSRSRSKYSSSEGGVPPTPQGSAAPAFAKQLCDELPGADPERVAQWAEHVGKAPPLREDAPQSTSTIPCVLRRIPDDWRVSEALRAEATMGGVTDLDERIAKLREGPIGGSRGVFPDKLDDYIRSFFGKWKTWAEADRAKARAAAAAPPSSKRSFVPTAPEPKSKHLRIAKQWGVDLAPIIADLNERKIAETLGTERYLELLEQELAKRCAAKRDGRAA